MLIIVSILVGWAIGVAINKLLERVNDKLTHRERVYKHILHSRKYHKRGAK